MSRNIAPFPVRIAPELRERPEPDHTAEGRSLNAEIVQRLDLSLKSWTSGREALSAAIVEHVIGTLDR